MQRTRVKICGIRDADTARIAVDCGADMIGLVFVPDSPRCVTVDQARSVANALPASVEPVALFVDTPVDQVRRTAAALGLSAVQLHGTESPDDVAALAPLHVIKAIGYEPQHMQSKLSSWRGRGANLIAVLFDAAPPDSALPGGTGQTLDWAGLAQLQRDGELDGLPPMFLAGGLTPDNVAEAIKQLHPFAVDVSSGVESARGVKDHARIKAFCEAVHQADADAHS